VKTCGRGAVGVEFHLARRTVMALKGVKPRKVPVPNRCRHVQYLAVDRNLQEDRKQKRKPMLGGCVRASRAMMNA